jgi:Mg-chelatase subunit ChlD
MKNSADITIVLDRSGSMQSVAKETILGFNTFLFKQKSGKYKANLTLVQFDHEYDLLYQSLDVHEALPLTRETYVPRGMTALLDAIGKTINVTKDRIKLLNNQGVFPKVIFVIITDGHENNSKVFNRSQIFEKINKMEKKHNWEFVFLGANQDAIEEAGFMGISKSRSMTFKASGKGVLMMFDAVSDNIQFMLSNDSSFTFKETQRKEQDLPPKKNKTT